MVGLHRHHHALGGQLRAFASVCGCSPWLSCLPRSVLRIALIDGEFRVLGPRVVRLWRATAMLGGAATGLSSEVEEPSCTVDF